MLQSSSRYKRSIPKTVIHQANQISDPSSLQNEIVKLLILLQANEHSKNLIHPNNNVQIFYHTYLKSLTTFVGY